MTQENIEKLITSYVDGELTESSGNDIKGLIEKDRGLKLDYTFQVFIKSIISERLKIKPVPERIKNKIIRKINPSKKFLATFFSRLLF
jgi:hypothetical protein